MEGNIAGMVTSETAPREMPCPGPETQSGRGDSVAVPSAAPYSPALVTATSLLPVLLPPFPLQVFAPAADPALKKATGDG